MHPSGVEFGLSKGLLQLKGEEVLLSDAVLEAISIEAQIRVHLRKPPIDGNFLVDMTVRAAENLLGNQSGRRQQIVPFFAGLNKTMYYTLCRVAEQAGLATKEPRRLLIDPEFWHRFSEGAVDIKIKPGHNIAKIQKSLFKVCLKLVREQYAKTNPENARHADLTALFIFNFWNATGLLPMTQAVVILGANM